MLMRAYFDDRGEGEQRREIVIPDTAHGTNPASVTMAGYELVGVKTDARGNIDVDDLRGKVGPQTAGLMLTNPSTLGLFDENIEEIERIFHDAGALMYYDGANLNAVCGISRPGDMGFDIVHINLHKTFSQPHGGGGPGGGPIAVARAARAVPAGAGGRPARRRRRSGSTSTGRSRSARCAAFTGPFGVFVRSYAYIRAYGPALREMSEAAVLNANYLLARLKDAYDLPFDRLCMHEFVLSARTLKREHGVSALDVAKRLMDYGFHPPTIYFPLIVPEALMIEPTETEPKERLDEFVRRDAGDRARGGRRPGGRSTRRRTTGRSARLDEVKAAKRAVVRYGFEEHPNLPTSPQPRGRGAEGGLAWTAASASGSSASTRRASTTLLERRLADRLAEDLEGSPVAREAARRGGCATSRSRPTAYALSLAGPPAHSRRLREIEDEIAAHEERLARAWDELSSSTSDDARGARARAGVRSPSAGASTPSTT